MEIRKSIKIIIAPLRSLKNFCFKVYFYYLGTYNPKKLAAILYKNNFKKILNLENPIDFNEKIIWLQFFSDTSMWPLLADKYRVREYVKSKGFEQYLNEIYAVYDTEKDIDINELPNSFVLKMNNGCGDRLIIKNKSEYTNEKIKKYFKKHKKWGIYSAEPHYLHIKPCIIAEKLLIDKNSNSDFLIDYRFFCFDGEPLYVRVDAEYGEIKLAFYDIEWNRLDVLPNHYSNHVYDRNDIKKPISFDIMTKMAKALTIGFPLLRVDFYEINGNPIFGEITCSPGGGGNHFNQEFLDQLGSLVKLPPKIK
ncbi:hypothetical protein AGMMS49944_25830 [Spirochaetia bacterium]|nr:hypothetical protein AGMMS49944_25830 [Spirochaetia bacterium]